MWCKQNLLRKRDAKRDPALRSSFHICFLDVKGYIQKKKKRKRFCIIFVSRRVISLENIVLLACLICLSYTGLFLCASNFSGSNQSYLSNSFWVRVVLVPPTTHTVPHTQTSVFQSDNKLKSHKRPSSNRTANKTYKSYNLPSVRRNRHKKKFTLSVHRSRHNKIYFVCPPKQTQFIQFTVCPP